MYIFLIMAVHVHVFTFQANINSTNWKLVSAILVGALYPNVVQVMKPSSKFSQGSTGKNIRVHVCRVHCNCNCFSNVQINIILDKYISVT